MTTTVLLGYPIHLQQIHGVVSFSNFEVNTSSLNGLYLHFAYLLAVGDKETVSLEFSPDASPCKVRTGEVGALRVYEPNVSREEMIAAVSKEFGDRISIPKPNL